MLLHGSYQGRRPWQVCIETVLAYRTKRGFREQPVMSEWQDSCSSEPRSFGDRGDLDLQGGAPSR